MGRFGIVNTETGEEVPYLEEFEVPLGDPTIGEEWHRAVVVLEGLWEMLPSTQARRSATTAVQLVTRWLGWLWGVE